MASKISEEEIQQLLRTVEMFEAITESQHDDYQSLEILKEAYIKLSRTEDGLRVSKKLAQAYVNLGQISQAILEYEGILQEYPNDASVVAALGELEQKTSMLAAEHATAAPLLAEDSKPSTPAGGPAGAPALSPNHLNAEDGDQALADVLIADKFVTEQAVDPLLQRLKTMRENPEDKSHPFSLVQLLVTEQISKLDDVLTFLINKSGLPYLPLSIYDVDRDVAHLLPLDVCMQFCIVPVDLISRSVLIATANPFDQVAHQQIEAMLDYGIFWYVSSPTEIMTTLLRAHGLDGARQQQVRG
jgi:tetratricopeptide (TPR) repeat protein